MYQVLNQDCPQRAVELILSAFGEKSILDQPACIYVDLSDSEYAKINPIVVQPKEECMVVWVSLPNKPGHFCKYLERD